jgi:MYXO-CTERM domain-containing protein
MSHTSASLLRSCLAAAALAAVAFTHPAHADVGPHRSCDTKGKGCTTCSNDRSSTPEANGYAACAKAATGKGLVEACRDNSGAIEHVYFCPKGTKVDKGFGCALSPGGGEADAALVAAALAALGALGRRRRK